MTQQPDPSHVLATADIESVLGISNDTGTDASDGHKRLIAEHEPLREYYIELGKYVSGYLAENPQYKENRATAISKLLALTDDDIYDLSTDVYDEMIRRSTQAEAPHLPGLEGYHPLRNDARKKMSKLPTERFYWLVGDVYFGVALRYPELKDEVDGVQ